MQDGTFPTGFHPGKVPKHKVQFLCVGKAIEAGITVIEGLPGKFDHIADG